jgi:Tol biopolymer transport system component
MQAERWKKVEELYEAAIALPPEKRAEFLAQACPADAGLRGEVQSLLAQQADSFLESAPLSAIKTLSPGARLGNFEIVELIGRGGMGEVYRARDSRLKRDVAIKVLPAGLARDPDRIARFEREARAAGALNHPNIVAVHEIGRDDDTYWIATELVAGEPLASVIERGPLGVPKALEIATQIAEGLAAAHAAGIVHRDLKPANIMVTRDGRVKILDFGLALRQRTSQDSTTMHMTDEGTVLGTAGYMSPEQVRGETVDQRSDLFSFGVILYEMLGGKWAFAGASSVEVMHAILKEDPPELPAAVPPAIDRIVRRCLQKDRERRFQTAADLGWALQPLPLSAAQVERPKRSAWWKWAILGAVTTAAIAVYWLGVRHPSPSAPAEFVLRRLTDGVALTRNAVISPDGKLVAYDKEGDIWVQQVDSDTAIRLTDDPADDSDPAFSADGAQIAFRSEREGGGIYVVPSLGGAARELVPEGRFPSFSPDGRWLSYWMGPEADKFGSKLFVRPLSGGPAVQVGAEIATPCGAVWSPDSSRILLLADCADPIATVWIYTVGRKELKRNPDLRSDPDEIDQWIANPPRLLTGKRVADAYEVTAVPLSADGTRVTGTPQKLTSVTDRLLGVSASLDGRMVLSVSAAKSHLWGLPIDATGKAAGDAKQITEGSYDESEPSLSKDGGEMAFISPRANGDRVFYRNLATGRAKELSPDGPGSYMGAVFTPDGKGVISARDGLLVYIPISGGLTKTIWGNPEGRSGVAVAYSVLLWDLSPDGKTALFYTGGDPSKIRLGVVRQLDLASGSAKTLLDDPDFELWQAHFSHDGRWVVFNATPNVRTSSRIYVAPFRRAPVPRSEWIPVTQGDWDDKPRFSSDDKLIFFVSSALGRPHRFWAQRLNSDMRPDGKPVAVYSPTHGRRVMTETDNEISVGQHLIVFGQTESTGNIWVAAPVKKDAH